MARTFVGIDLGWTTGHTGLAVVADSGRLVASGRVLTDDEIDAWLVEHGGDVAVAAVDAPLIVPNETGMRVPERLIGSAFGAFGASAHTSNRRKFGGQPVRALRLAQRSGWQVDPRAGAGPVCLEVYPHPAMIGLFGLDYRLAYKKGRAADRAAGFAVLVRHLESLVVLDLPGSARWAHLKAVAAAPARGDLNRIEDELDAILCAHLAWLWHHEPGALQVYGSVEEGYIVAPPPPGRRAVRPARPSRAAGV